jgi:hypothetical protein
MSNRTSRVATRIVASAIATLVAGRAHAVSTIKTPDPPVYSVEIEPKLNLSYLFGTAYGGDALGPGVRFSIPLMSPGFVKTINDSVGIGFGLDILHYNGGYYGGYYGYCNGNPKDCPGYSYGYDSSFWAVGVPVVMQWNFWLTDKWSVFGEPGLTLRHAFFPDYPWCQPPNYNPKFGPCVPDQNNLFFTFYAGGRYNFNDKFALTMRLGYPIDFSIGLSIFL